MSFTRSRSPSMSITFRGFTSRWTMPIACGGAERRRDLAARCARRAPAGTGPRLMTSRSVVPRTYSSTRKNEPSSSLPKSVAAATLGCWMCAPATASRSKRGTRSGRPCGVGVEHLDRHVLVHVHVLGQVHRADAAHREQLDDPVPPRDDLAEQLRRALGGAGREARGVEGAGGVGGVGGAHHGTLFSTAVSLPASMKRKVQRIR